MDRPALQTEETARLLSPGKIAFQVIFWLIGLALLTWIIRAAVREGDWSRVAAADPALIALLLGCTVVSALLNGATFWITIQPVRRVGFWDMQRLNLVGNMLNYAPVRAGAIARIMYHLRVDRLSLLQIGAWFAMIGSILLLSVGACLIATLVYGPIDFVWIALVIGQMALGIVAAQFIMRHRLIVKHGRGIDALFRDHRGAWGCAVLRLADIAAFTGRMGAALAILGIHLPPQQVVVLAVVALASSLIPFGRVGFREACVVLAGGAFVTEQDVPWEQLALVESAGEAIVFVPAGAVAMMWFVRRWRRAR